MPAHLGACSGDVPAGDTSRTADLAVSPQFHVDKKGRVNFAQTELLIHVVNRETNRILDVERYVTWPITQPGPLSPQGASLTSRCPSNPSLPRVIQMIDENKEQLRNLFRNYNVLDVQPAITARAPDDLSALQVTAQLGLEMAVARRWGNVPSHPPWPSMAWKGVPPKSFWVGAQCRFRAGGCHYPSISLRWQSSCWPSCSSWLPCSSSS